MEAKKNFIVMTIEQSNKSNHSVYGVYVTGDEGNKVYCKSAYKAMRRAFFLKHTTGVAISGKCLKLLSQVIAAQKEAKAQEAAKEQAAEAPQQEAVVKAPDTVEQPVEEAEKPAKPKRTRQRKAKVAAVAQ